LNYPQGALGKLQSSPRVAEWLPAPPMVKKAPPRASAPPISIWLPLDKESLAEKGLMAGLIVAAAIGIGYGFNCLLNLVENWAVVNASIHSMIQ